MTDPPPGPAPVSYLLVGPPDLMQDIILDFADVGWAVAGAGWQAVITAPPEDAGAPAPEWPTEITLAGVSREGHAAAVHRFLTPDRS